MTETEFLPLEPGQLRVMRINGAIGAGALLAVWTGGLAVLATALDARLWWLIVPLIPTLAWIAFVAPGRRFATWGYRTEPDELHVRYGLWTRTETVVPLGKVQHVDVEQGPVERANGVCRLVLHTAGTANSTVTLPGLSRATAEGLRDEVRARVRDDAA